MQNNRFCNSLIISLLGNSYVCEKYLQRYLLLFVYLRAGIKRFVYSEKDKVI